MNTHFANEKKKKNGRQIGINNKNQKREEKKQIYSDALISQRNEWSVRWSLHCTNKNVKIKRRKNYTENDCILIQLQLTCTQSREKNWNVNDAEQ